MIVLWRLCCRIYCNVVVVVDAVVVDALVAVVVAVDTAAVRRAELEVVAFHWRDQDGHVARMQNWHHSSVVAAAAAVVACLPGSKYHCSQYYSSFSNADHCHQSPGNWEAKLLRMVQDPKIFPTIAPQCEWPIFRCLDRAAAARRPPPSLAVAAADPATTRVASTTKFAPSFLYPLPSSFDLSTVLFMPAFRRRMTL